MLDTDKVADEARNRIEDFAVVMKTGTIVYGHAMCVHGNELIVETAENVVVAPQENVDFIVYANKSMDEVVANPVPLVQDHDMSMHW